MENDLEFLQHWYIANCDGDWEHSYGVKIETLDNPGWHVTVDLNDTKFEDLLFDEKSDLSDNNWYNIFIKEKKLNAFGDSNKLIFLTNKLKEILTTKD